MISVETKKLIAYWNGDVAGKNMADFLMEKLRLEQTDLKFDGFPVYKKDDIALVCSKDSVLYFKNLGDYFQTDICIVASRHKSESKRPTLTCHSPGNFNKADFGGEERSLATAPALYIKKALVSLQMKKENEQFNYEVSLEVTHHGPTELPFPIIFVEVGSSEEQWQNREVCNATAETIAELVTEPIEAMQVAIGFGGPHYAPNFSKIVLDKEIATGHIAPKYAMDSLNKDIVKQMLEKTFPKPNLAVLDWKGLRSDERAKVIEILEDFGMEWKKTSELKL